MSNEHQQQNNEILERSLREDREQTEQFEKEAKEYAERQRQKLLETTQMDTENE